MYSNQPEIQLPNGWEYVDLLGKGSFGRVYRAKRTIGQYTEWAAIKHISIPSEQGELDAVCADLGTRDKDIVNSYFSAHLHIMLEEYFKMQSLQGQTNIVTCHDIQQIPKADGIGYDVYIRMELLESLGKRSVDNSIDRNEVIHIGKDICKALMLLKSKGIIHRDIKPENIFVNSQGDYKLGDFGASRNIQGTSTMMSMKGTIDYMSPEIIQLQPVGFTSDIYSLGIVMYKLMNRNACPFMGEEDKKNPEKKSDSNARRLRGEALPMPVDADENLGKIILKACAHNPKDRWQTPEEMYNALANLTEIPSVPPNPPPLPKKSRQDTEISTLPLNSPPKKSKHNYALLIIVLVMLIAGFFIGRHLGIQNRQYEEKAKEVYGAEEEVYGAVEAVEEVFEAVEAAPGNTILVRQYDMDTGEIIGERYERDITINRSVIWAGEIPGYKLMDDWYKRVHLDSNGNVIEKSLQFRYQKGQEIDEFPAGVLAKVVLYDVDTSLTLAEDYQEFTDNDPTIYPFMTPEGYKLVDKPNKNANGMDMQDGTIYFGYKKIE